MKKPFLLVVLDGFGIGDGGDADATALAVGPFLDRIAHEFPTAQVETSGVAVGLPPGQMGNSEVGHMTMGAGRIIDQDLTRISKALESGVPPVIDSLFTDLAGSGATLHLMGLLSDGGVHSHEDHLHLLISAARAREIATTVDVFLDGRDTPPRSALTYLERLEAVVERTGATISTVSGRFYAMDRDNRWDRVGQAYAAITGDSKLEAPTARAAVTEAYARGENDEFVAPTVITGSPTLSDGDAVLFFNFRADRARELTNAFTDQQPEAFGSELVRTRRPQLRAFVCLTEYDESFELPVAFTSPAYAGVLGETLSANGLSQLRTAETEKYAHVTFFFNAGVEQPFPGEDRVLVASPRDVETYDHKPEMSALEVTDRLVAHIRSGEYDFILVNYANPDMVGHTGVLDAAVKAVETIDECLDRACRAVLDLDGQVLITADHGNCEQMVDKESGEPHTAHTTNPVPLHWLANNIAGRSLTNGGLADIAPTVLDLMGMSQPAEMTGRSLVVPK